MAFGETWSETDPINHTKFDQQPGFVRSLKTAIRERLQFGGMYFPSSDDALAGEYSYLRMANNASPPTAVAGKWHMYVTASGLFIRDPAGTDIQITDTAGVIGIVPAGGIIIWSGTIAAIPSGWSFCDGTDNAAGSGLDLRDRMIVCAKQDDAGAPKTNVTGSLTVSGGAATYNLSHTHSGPSHTHSTPAVAVITPFGGGIGVAGGVGTLGTTASTTGSGGTGATGSGGSASQSVMNPYYALALIEKD
jgi:hypothetical protein